MTAGRTNHTKFAAPPREEPITFPAPSGDWGTVVATSLGPLDPEYVQHLKADPEARRKWLQGEWTIDGDTT